MPAILQVIIRKDYAAALMEHLQKEQAIEIVAEDTQTYPSGRRKRSVKRWRMYSSIPTIAALGHRKAKV